MQTYTGSCHCQAIKYSFESDEIKAGMACNCSYCGRKGTVLHFIPASAFTLLSGENSLTEYRFNTEKIEHSFCKTCGVQCFGKGQMPDGTPTMAINLNTAENIEKNGLIINHYDGKTA